MSAHIRSHRTFVDEIITLRSAYMGLGIYGFFGYMVNFWVDPNGMIFYTIEYFGYKGYISDIWFIFPQLLS